jgi:hypothetical protein
MKEKQHLRAVFLYLGWLEPCRLQATGEAGSIREAHPASISV